MTKKLLIPIISLPLCLTMVMATAYAEVYTWTDGAGNIVYSDKKSSNDAKTSPPSSKTNYYSAPKSVKKTSTKNAEPLAELATLTAEEESTDTATAPLSERDCEQQYQRSCDEVDNWKKYALEACGNDPRCEDEDFLDRKYRPRSLEEILAIAHKAATRNNFLNKKIAQFLNKKYANYCENQAAMYCQNKPSSQCKAQMLHYCEDPRELQDIFNRYDNLSVIEKKEIIEKAKKLAIANGENSLDYEQMLASILEILISQALMGL
ncbi:MAG: DUF4124 domain-containing protein [Pseudomonadales bacterium]